MAFTHEFKMEVAGLSTEDLKELNRMVVDILKLRMAHANVVAKVGLKVGDVVKIHAGKNTPEQDGVIVKIKKTNATVNIGGFVWSVPMAMLTKKEEVNA